MANSYLNLQYSYSRSQASYESPYEYVMPSIGSALNDCLQQSATAFGLPVEQTIPGNYLTIPVPHKSLHPPCSDCRFIIKVPVRVRYSEGSYQSEPLDLSMKPKPNRQVHQNAESNRCPLKLNIAPVTSIAVEGCLQADFINNSLRASTAMEAKNTQNSLPNESLLKPFEQTAENRSAHLECRRDCDKRPYQNDPAYRKRIREYQKKRYQNDFNFRESMKKRQKELRKNPVYRTASNIYMKTYAKVLRATQNKIQAKAQARYAREQYFQSLLTSTSNGDNKLPLPKVLDR